MPIMGIPPVCCPPIIGIALEAPGPIGIPCAGWVRVPFTAGGGVLVCASTPVADPARIAAIKRAFREDIAHSPFRFEQLSSETGLLFREPDQYRDRLFRFSREEGVPVDLESPRQRSSGVKVEGAVRINGDIPILGPDFIAEGHRINW